MFLISLGGMLLVYIGLTTSIEQFMSAKAHGKGGRVASILALFFIFAHSPMYNFGNNALTYSTYRLPRMSSRVKANSILF